jgi:hypothetical protein
VVSTGKASCTTPGSQLTLRPTGHVVGLCPRNECPNRWPVLICGVLHFL